MDVAAKHRRGLVSYCAWTAEHSERADPDGRRLAREIGGARRYTGNSGCEMNAFQRFRRTRCGRVIDFEAKGTWPRRVHEVLSSGFDQLCRYELQKSEIDARCARDVWSRCNPPPNEFEAKRAEVIAEVDALLSTQRVLGFHCTRLLTYEVDAVRLEGLRPLTERFATERIDRALSTGGLLADVARVIRERNKSADPGRVGRVSFVNMRSELACESSVGRFFRCWGGEAIYVGYEPEFDPLVGAVLKNMGEPCIVLAALPAISLDATLGAHFARAFLNSRRVRKVTVSFETQVEQAVPGEWILDVVSCRDRRFEDLTGSSKWKFVPG